MKYTIMKLGKNKQDVKVSQLGFGAMRFPQKDGQIDQVQVDEMVKYAFDNGINYYDTAYIYEGSEIALGKAIKQLDREKIFIADKMPYWSIDSQQYLTDTFNESLQRLQIDYFDFYLMHCMCEDTLPGMIKYDGIKFAQKMKEEGKIKYLGFSIHAGYDILTQVLDLADFDFVQLQYNYLDLNDAPGQKGYDELVKRDIPIIIMEPLKGGTLADLPNVIAQPFVNLGESNVSFAFRWLAEQKNVSTILSGMSSMEQLKQNIEIFNDIKPLSKEEHSAIEKVKANIEKYQKVPCTGCKYCLPCPVGVGIPDIFKAWNTASMPVDHSGFIAGADINYDMAASCVNCKKCMEHCPQNINIPAKLQQLVEERV